MKHKLMMAMVAISLAGCSGLVDKIGTAGPEASFGRTILAGVGQRLRGRGDTAPAPRDPAAVAADALKASNKPLILVEVAGFLPVQAAAEVQRNADVRTYHTGGDHAFMLRGGMLAGTRGLGNDLMAVEAEGSRRLVLARQAGTAQRTHYYLTGDGQERPLPLTCEITPGAAVVTEVCANGPLKFTNTYVVQGGRIAASEQFLALGSAPMKITVLRD